MLKSRSTLTDVRAFVSRGWTARPSYSYVVPLTDLAAQWGAVEQNLRRLVGRCESQGMTLVADGAFEPFYDLHATTMDRHDTATYLPRLAFARYHEILQRAGLCRLYHARLPDGRVIASQLTLLG